MRSFTLAAPQTFDLVSTRSRRQPIWLLLGSSLLWLGSASAANVAPAWQQTLEPCSAAASSRVIGLSTSDSAVVVNAYCQGDGATKTWRLAGNGTTTWSRTLCASCPEIASDPSLRMVAPAVITSNGDIVSVYRSEYTNLRLARVMAGGTLRHDVAIGYDEGPAPGLFPIPAGTVIVQSAEALTHVGGTGSIIGDESLTFDPILAPYYFSFADLKIGSDGYVWRALRHAPGSLDFGQNRDFAWRPLNLDFSVADGNERLVQRGEETLARLIGNGTLVQFDAWFAPEGNFRLKFYDSTQALLQTRVHPLSANTPVLTARNASDQLAVVTRNGLSGPYAVSRFSSTGDLLNTSALSFSPTALVLADSGEIAVLGNDGVSAEVQILNITGDRIARWQCQQLGDCAQFPDYVAPLQNSWIIAGTDRSSGNGKAWVARLNNDINLFQSSFE